MSLQVIPLSASPNQSFTVQLDVDGNPLTLHVTLRFNEMAYYWVMSISDANNNLLIDSVPVLTGDYPAANLLEQHRYLEIGSWYVVNVSNLPAQGGRTIGYGEGLFGFNPYGGDSSGKMIDWPTNKNLGTDYQLWVSDTPIDSFSTLLLTSDSSVTTVSSSMPTISLWPTASSIVYGQILFSSALTGGTASVAGTFAWTTPSTGPAVGTGSQSVTFIPTDTVAYALVTGSTSITTAKATPTVSVWPTASSIIHGQTLASSTLTGGAGSTTGTFAWTTSSTAPTTGSTSQSITFTPTDTVNYNNAVGSTSITTAKATPTVSVWSTASSIITGQTLASSTLTGGTASVAGVFAWTTPSTVPTLGTTTQSVTFTPTDTTNYNNVVGSTSIVDGSGAPTIPGTAISSGILDNASTVGTPTTPANWLAAHDSFTPGASSGTSAYISPTVGRNFNFTYTANAGERYSIYFATDTAKQNFCYDLEVAFTDPSQVLNMELDMNQVLADGTTTIFDFQCAHGSGKWEYDGWIASSVAGDPQTWGVSTYHHIRIFWHRDSTGHTTTWDGVEFDGVWHPMSYTANTNQALGWTPVGVLLINFQIEGSSAVSGTVDAYGRNITVWRW
jgi:hypothetical protein